MSNSTETRNAVRRGTNDRRDRVRNRRAPYRATFLSIFALSECGHITRIAIDMNTRCVYAQLQFVGVILFRLHQLLN